MFTFDNSYARLPERFYSRLPPTPVTRPGLIRINDNWASHLGLDPVALASPEGLEVLAGNRAPEGAEPLAMAYAGHQFGGWVPQLGDGRALLLGEVIGKDGLRYDIQLKGSGPTPYSRMGDGRAWIGPVLREYLVSEAMHALGVPTTRALAAVTTGQPVHREEGPMPGAVLTRVSRAHVRVGTFQFFAAREDTEALSDLVAYCLDRLYPGAEGGNPAQMLLDAVIEAQARLIPKWMLLGFIHGVMNTDNMSIAAETIDYGPCAFMDVFHPGTVFSSIDRGGRYSWQNQPGIAHWNLANLAQALLPLLSEDKDQAVKIAEASLDRFPDLYHAAYDAEMAMKLGLAVPEPSDRELGNDLLAAMANNKADFTLTFRGLCDIANPTGEPGTDDGVRGLFIDSTAFDEWAIRWRERLSQDRTPPEIRKSTMHRANPAIIPRNHLVEAAIQAALAGDLAPFHALTEALERPFDDPQNPVLADPPEPDARVYQTFCGT